MADASVEENTQFSLEVIDLDEDIELTDVLFCNQDVEEDCALSEEENYNNSLIDFINYRKNFLIRTSFQE